MKILGTEKLHDREKEAILNVVPDAIFLEAGPDGTLSDLIGEAHVLYGFPRKHLDEIAASKTLKLVHVQSTGADTFLTPAFATSDIILTNSKGVHAKPVAEHAFALLVGLVYDLGRRELTAGARGWVDVMPERFEGKTACLLGLGAIGMELARKCKAFDMKVTGVVRSAREDVPSAVDALYTTDLLDLALAEADYVLCSLPLTQETLGLLSFERFFCMKPTAYFVNVGRGPVVVEEDLVRALRQGIIRGAGLDVFEVEPLPKESPLWEMDNVLITPHLAGHSPKNRERSFAILVENLGRLAGGLPLVNVVDKARGY